MTRELAPLAREAGAEEAARLLEGAGVEAAAALGRLYEDGQS